MRILLWILVVASCLSMAAAAEAPASTPKPQRPKSKEACEARGGEWILFPMGQFYFCSIATTDGGKRCNASSECEGDCEAVGGPDEKAMHGECSLRLATPGGCPKLFEGGKVVNEPCI